MGTIFHPCFQTFCSIKTNTKDCRVGTNLQTIIFRPYSIQTTSFNALYSSSGIRVSCKNCALTLSESIVKRTEPLFHTNLHLVMLCIPQEASRVSCKNCTLILNKSIVKRIEPLLHANLHLLMLCIPPVASGSPVKIAPSLSASPSLPCPVPQPR